MFRSDGNTDAILGCARVQTFLLAELLMGCRPWVDCQGLGVSNTTCRLDYTLFPNNGEETYFARLEISLKPSTSWIPAAAPPLTPKERTPPNPRLKYRLAVSWLGWLSSPGYETQLTFSFFWSQSARIVVLLACRSARRLRVSKPNRSCCAAKGFNAVPRSRKISTRTRIAKVTGPNVSQNFRPWYPADGSINCGNRAAFLPQSNLPLSTTTPPMVVPCPPIHLVALWTTMSAP